MDTDPQDPPRNAAQVVRRMLLRQNIAVDPETAQLVADAVQAVLHAGTPSRPPRRGPHVPAADCEPLFLSGEAPPQTIEVGGSADVIVRAASATHSVRF